MICFISSNETEFCFFCEDAIIIQWQSLPFKGNFTLGSSSSLSLDFTVNNQIIIIHLLWYWLLPFVVSF